MNMISTGAFLPEMDASNKQETTAEKFARVWEKKNAKAARAGGVSLMALSLAACGGSSEVAAPVVEADPEPEAPAVTTVSITLNDDDVTYDSNDFTTGADTITADGDTFNTGDIIAEPNAGDGDTLTISVDAALAATPTVVGVENITLNVTTFGAAAAMDVARIANGTLTVNNLQLAGTTDADINNAGNITVVAGTGVTGTIDVAMQADASTTVNAGSATNAIVAAAGTAADQTITVVSTADLDLTATGAATVAVSGAGDITLNALSANVITTGTITGAAGQNLILANSTIADATTISGFDSVQFDTNGAGAGAADVAFDARNISTVIHLTDTAAGGADTFTVASGANVTLDAGVDATFDIDDASASTTTTDGVINITLAEATTAATTDSIVTINGAGDVIGTVNFIANANQTVGGALDLRTTSAMEVTITGAGDVSFDTSNIGTAGSTLSAAGMAGDLTATAVANMLTITGGDGDDSITAVTAAAFALDGGAGDDTLVTVADMTSGTFTGFEVLTVADGSDFLASQLHGYTAVVSDIAGGGILDIATGGAGADSIDITTIDLSGLTFASAADIVTLNLTNIDAAAVLNTAGFTVTGTNAIDQVTGSANDDNITLGGGADTLSTGGGTDTVDLTEATAAADVITIEATSTDTVTITGFSAGGAATNDDLIFGEAAIEGTSADINDLVGGNGTLSITNATAFLSVTIDGSGGTDIGAAANTMVILDGDFANAAAVATALEDGGSHEATLGAMAADDAFLVAYDDGTNTYIATVHLDAAVADGQAANSGDMTVANYVTLSGLADATDLADADFGAFVA